MHDAPAQLERVSTSFGSVPALRDVDLTLRPGETLALLGPNGAGKTTAVRTLLGLVRPDSGRATLFGRDPRNAKHRVRVGAMLQAAGLPATLTVREHVALFRTYYPAPLAIDEALRLAGLESVQHQRFGDLSGGQKQRVGFALAICGNPDALFLDEPSAALDVEARLAMWATIRGVVARGTSVLLTTHDLAEADALADRIAVMRNGRIVADDTPAAIKAAAAGGRIVRCATSLDDAALRGIAGVRTVRRDGTRVELAVDDADLAIRALYARDTAFTLFDVADSDLEDAFLAITRTEIPA